MLLLINKTIYPYFQQEELVDLFELLIKEGAKLENNRMAHRDVRPGNFLIKSYKKNSLDHLQLSWAKSVNSIDMNRTTRSYFSYDKKNGDNKPFLNKHNSLVVKTNKRPRIEDIINQKFNK